MERRGVFRSDRIRVTERIIRGLAADAVLELGAGDHSFRDARPDVRVWVRGDFAPPCDVVLDLNTDTADLPFRDGRFDVVICTQVLEHLLWPQDVIRGAYRVLRPGGALVVSVPNVVSLTYRVAWALGRLPSCAASGNLPGAHRSTAYQRADGRMVGGHVVDFTRTRLVGLLEEAGFQTARTLGSGIIWHRQVMPAWAVPVSLSSNIICLAVRPA